METKTSGSHGWCSAISCKNSRKKNLNLSFFHFPKEKERCTAWIQECRRSDLIGKSPDHLYRNLSLCGEHFELSQFMNAEARNKLIPNAVPTVFYFPNRPKPVTVHRSMLIKKEFPIKTGKRLDDPNDVDMVPTKFVCNNEVAVENAEKKQGKRARYKNFSAKRGFAISSTNNKIMKVKHSRHNCYAEACIELGYYIKSDSFHQLPRDPDLKKKWIEILKIPERIVNHPSLSKNLKICSNHFTTEDYRMVGQRRMLKLDAVPSKGLEKGSIPTLSADFKDCKRRKNYALDEEIPEGDVKDTPSVLDNEESKNKSPTSRPKRRAAAAAAKKMIEATSTAIDRSIVEKEKEDIKSPKIKQKKDTSSGISIKTPAGQTIYLKNMSVIHQVEQKKKTATDKIVSILNNPMPLSLSITPVSKPVPKARKSFPNSSGRISQLYKATKSSKKFTHSAVTSKNKDHYLDLDMQCFEEGLSPCQISAQNKAVMDYQVVMNKIRKYNQNRNYIVRYEDDPALPSDVTVN